MTRIETHQDIIQQVPQEPKSKSRTQIDVESFTETPQDQPGNVRRILRSGNGDGNVNEKNGNDVDEDVNVTGYFIYETEIGGSITETFSFYNADGKLSNYGKIPARTIMKNFEFVSLENRDNGVLIENTEHASIVFVSQSRETNRLFRKLPQNKDFPKGHEKFVVYKKDGIIVDIEIFGSDTIQHVMSRALKFFVSLDCKMSQDRKEVIEKNKCLQELISELNNLHDEKCGCFGSDTTSETKEDSEKEGDTGSEWNVSGSEWNIPSYSPKSVSIASKVVKNNNNEDDNEDDSESDDSDSDSDFEDSDGTSRTITINHNYNFNIDSRILRCAILITAVVVANPLGYVFLSLMM